jgi:hypothetical protein
MRFDTLLQFDGYMARILKMLIDKFLLCSVISFDDRKTSLYKRSLGHALRSALDREHRLELA